jgi:hypothetical protein
VCFQDVDRGNFSFYTFSYFVTIIITIIIIIIIIINIDTNRTVYSGRPTWCQNPEY